MKGPIIYPPQPITFEEYMAEEPVKRRYDIINGVRVFAVPPTLRHQGILGNIMLPLSHWGDRSGFLTLFSIFDVLISWTPFCTRQPDVLLVSQERWRQHEAAAGDGWPLTVAPELVVEILSTIDRELALENKLRDYRQIGVDECWVVRPEEQTVEVLCLALDVAETVATYGSGDIINSDALPGLTMTVADILTQ